MTSSWTARLGFATSKDIFKWFLVSTFIAVFMLVTVWVSSKVWNVADINSGQKSVLLNPNPEVHDSRQMQTVLSRNMLVLAIHFMACYLGALIGRPHKPAHARFGKWGTTLHREMPSWVKRLAMLYALTATLFSVIVQSTGIGLVLNDTAAAANVSQLQMLAVTLPHALPELIGVFLPLGLFLIAARRQQLKELGVWCWQSLLWAVPLLIVASYIETFFTPGFAQGILF